MNEWIYFFKLENYINSQKKIYKNITFDQQKLSEEMEGKMEEKMS